MAHVSVSHVTYGRVMAHVWLSHGTRINERRHTWKSHLVHKCATSTSQKETGGGREGRREGLWEVEETEWVCEEGHEWVWEIENFRGRQRVNETAREKGRKRESDRQKKGPWHMWKRHVTTSHVTTRESDRQKKRKRERERAIDRKRLSRFVFFCLSLETFSFCLFLSRERERARKSFVFFCLSLENEKEKERKRESKDRRDKDADKYIYKRNTGR